MSELVDRMPFAAAWRALDLDRPDAETVTGRLAMYRLLVERTGHERSPFWGYAAQLAWQAASERLGGAEHIAPASWWGACNFALSAIPYAAAAEQKLVAPAAIDARGFEPALPLWHAALRALVATGTGDREPARFSLWRAHLASITLAVGRHADLHAALPATERAFANGWVRMVELFGAAALRTDLAYLAPLPPAELPSRVLGERDDLADLSRHERAIVRRTIALGARPAWRWPIELAMWRRMMRTPGARASLDTVMGGLFGSSWRNRVRVLAYAL